MNLLLILLTFVVNFANHQISVLVGHLSLKIELVLGTSSVYYCVYLYDLAVGMECAD